MTSKISSCRRRLIGRYVSYGCRLSGLASGTSGKLWCIRCLRSKNFSIGPNTPSTNSEMTAAAVASAVFGQTGRNSQRGGEPDRTGRCQALDLHFVAELENRARAEKANPRRYSLNHARWAVDVLDRAAVAPPMTKMAAADRDHHVRAQAGPMSVPFALEADRAAKNGRRANAGQVVSRRPANSKES